LHILLPICGKFTRALLAHQIFYARNSLFIGLRQRYHQFKRFGSCFEEKI
jgi:hypothetical protein